MISSGDIYVIDISYLDDATQAFVFGSVLRAVNSLCLDDDGDKQEHSPNRIVMFMDELNKFAMISYNLEICTSVWLKIKYWKFRKFNI